MGIFGRKKKENNSDNNEKVSWSKSIIEHSNKLSHKHDKKESDPISEREKLIRKLDEEFLEKKKFYDEEILQLNDELLYQDFGVYEPKYNCLTSEEYSEKIKNVRAEQKQKIKDKVALDYNDAWTLDGSRVKGRALNNDNMKMVLLAFNSQCDTLINKVKFNNVIKIEERIKKIATKINKLNKRNQISIRNDYIQLKIKELHLAHEYEMKKKEEKEEIRRIREQEREEAKLQKEIEEKRKNIRKEQAHYINALSQLLVKMKGNSNDLSLQEKRKELEKHLSQIDADLKDIDYREANKRAGYVYVISNIGSFGEGVYKIGMTRRLDPMDRINELGDASVPFKFDVHAMIFSDDAPTLEAKLHKAFEKNKVNMVNNRKEFFKVPLSKIEEVVKQNYDKTVDFIKTPSADQFRETEMIKKHSVTK